VTDTTQAVPLKLDLGCGKNKAEGFVGVDSVAFDGVDVVADLRKRWPWADDSVDEIRASHFVEHLEPDERIHFANEAYRVLKKGGKVSIIVPHWSSTRAYGDLTHKWPPVCEFWLYYLNADWRKTNAPHNADYTCDFDGNPTFGYAPGPALTGRSYEYVQFALQHYRECAADMIATLSKSK
jgi:SAM-dependent methyltransferase